MAGDDAWGDTWTDTWMSDTWMSATWSATSDADGDVRRMSRRHSRTRSIACVACESFDLCAPCFDAGTCHAAHAFERVDDAAASLGLGSAGVPVERPEGARRGGGVLVEEAARRRRRRRPAPGADANANSRGGGERASGEESDAAGLSLRGTSVGLSARRGEARRD